MTRLLIVVLLLAAAWLCLYARRRADMEWTGFIGFWLCLITAVSCLAQMWGAR